MGQYLSRTGVSEPSGSRHYRPTPTSAQILQFGSDTPVRLRYSSSAQILRYSETPSSAQIIGQLPRVSREDPERIRVDSVFETLVCVFVLCLSVCKFSHFLYYKVL